LIAYWESDVFKTNHHIYKIISGGWANGEPLPSGILSVTSAVEITEWFVATTNGCMNILGSEPTFIEFSNTSISSK
jgi:hypothetical protein